MMGSSIRTATIIFLIILLLLCIISEFPVATGLEVLDLLSKGGNGIFNVCKEMGLLVRQVLMSRHKCWKN